MNIVTPFPSTNINTANVYTESARRDNQLREVIPPTTPTNAANAENKAQSDTEKAKQSTSNSGSTYDASGKVTDEKAVQQRDENNSEQKNTEQQNEQAAQQEAQEELQHEEDKQLINELKARDIEVRTHEQAHVNVGGQYAGSPSYDYQRGPNGANYAVGGEVPIDVGVINGNPKATIEKMQTVRAAALAPAEPSSADRAIAADATQKIATAQAELAATNNAQAKAQGDTKNQSGSEPDAQSGEKKLAKSELQNRDPQIEFRAGRIANFYQMATLPLTPAGFSAQI